jgi:LAGLIDADG DNA endonuclease family protein
MVDAPIAGGAMDLDDSFGHWLAGVADAVAVFRIARMRSHGNHPRLWPKFRFEIGLPAKDRALLGDVYSRLGCGALYLTGSIGSPHGSRRWVKFSTQSLDDCLQVISLFRRFPLRSTKRSQFDYWARAVEEMVRGEARSDAVISECLSELARLQRSEAPPGESVRDGPSMIAGVRPTCRCGCGQPTRLFSSDIGVPHPENPAFRSFIHNHHLRVQERPHCRCGCGQMTSLARHPASQPHPDDPNYCSFIRNHQNRLRRATGHAQ